MEKPIKILIADDEKNVIDSYIKVLNPASPQGKDDRLNELKNKLFNEPKTTKTSNRYELHCCNQGANAVEAVEKSLKEGSPFSIAFLDVRMPPGPDGVWTAKNIREIDPYINIVIVTAYSDISPSEISRQVAPPERLLYMQKPFHSHEIQQFAAALSAKWQAEKNLIESNLYLDKLVKQRTEELTMAIEDLEDYNKKFRLTAKSLKATESELESKVHDLAETNLALQKLISKNKKDRRDMEEKVLFTIQEMIEPYLDKLEKSPIDAYQKSFLKIIRNNIEEITAPFKKDLSHKFFKLTPIEINIASMIKQGVSTKEISNRLEISKRNVDFYRDRIREKIGIKNTKANLKTVLIDLELEFSRK